MERTIILNGREIAYQLEYKKVKNVNLRIKPDGTVFVSANRLHPDEMIEKLLTANSGMIIRTLDRVEKAKEDISGIEPFGRTKERTACAEKVEPYIKKYYPVFSAYCKSMPEIKYRKMKSRWGSCRPKQNILTFNSKLAYLSDECIEYVVVHEFAHYSECNHSKAFYSVVESVLPDWKVRRDGLRKYASLL